MRQIPVFKTLLLLRCTRFLVLFTLVKTRVQKHMSSESLLKKCPLAKARNLSSCVVGGGREGRKSPGKDKSTNKDPEAAGILAYLRHRC